eukprot:249348-Rhodomonas_salina.1
MLGDESLALPEHDSARWWFAELLGSAARPPGYPDSTWVIGHPGTAVPGYPGTPPVPHIPCPIRCEDADTSENTRSVFALEIPKAAWTKQPCKVTTHRWQVRPNFRIPLKVRRVNSKQAFFTDQSLSVTGTFGFSTQ